MTNSKHSDARRRTSLVIAITALTMVAEITAGFFTGSMALLADGWHMATHVGALSITWAGYYLVDNSAFRQRFTFGGGKVLVLGAYTSALFLLATAVWMVIESVARLIHPHEMLPKEAMVVTVIGLAVNLLSLWLLGDHSHGHDHGHSHGHDHSHKPKAQHKHVQMPHQHGANCDHDHDHTGHQHPAEPPKDLNMESAYAHVLADALTSVLALIALAGAWQFGWNWLDPLVGVFGAFLIFRWGVGLIKQSGRELLDAHASRVPPEDVESFLKAQGLNASCLHIWQIDSEKVAMHVRVTSAVAPLPTLSALRESILHKFKIDHLVIELSTAEVHCSLEGEHPGTH